MARTTDDLVDLLELRPTATEGVFCGHHPRTILQRTYGGQVLAQALMAAYHTVPEERVVHSVNAYFLSSGRTGADLFYAVETLRDGGTFSTRRIQVTQEGRLLFSMMASFHALEDGMDHTDSLPQDVRPPADCPPLTSVMNERFGSSPLWHEWDAIDVRFAGDSGEEGSIQAHAHAAHSRIWVRSDGRLPDDPRIHQAVLAYLSDMTLLSVATVPHRVAFLSPRLQMATVDHSLWFLRQVRADEWLLYDQVGPSASHALGLASGRLFQDGKLVGMSAQNGLLRMLKTERTVLT